MKIEDEENVKDLMLIEYANSIPGIYFEKNVKMIEDDISKIIQEDMENGNTDT